MPPFNQKPKNWVITQANLTQTMWTNKSQENSILKISLFNNNAQAKNKTTSSFVYFITNILLTMS